MARLLRDCNQTFVIELYRGRVFVHFVIMENLEVRLRKLPHSRLIDHPGSAAEKTLFDDRFKPVEIKTYPLSRAIEHFLNPQFSRIHANAKRALEDLKSAKTLSESDMIEDAENVGTPIPTTAAQPTGEDDMSKEQEVKIEADLKHYKKTEAASGRKSVDIGDDVAKLLRGKELPDIYELASKKLDLSVAALKKQYGHLNAGMQRMNLGNRLRGLARAKSKKAS